MSFTEQVKNELARLERQGKAERLAEILALMRMGASIVSGSRNAWGLEFSTGHGAVARRVLVSLKRDFGFTPATMVRQGRKLRKKNVYTLMVEPSPEGLAFMEHMGLSPLLPAKDSERLSGEEERRAYLAGAFLGGGSVSRPQSDYHLEMVTQSQSFAGEIIRVMQSFGLKGKMTDRKNDYIVYLKDGDQVGSFLQIAGAAQSYLEFESVRVMKDMRNRVNRQVNCETANLAKTVDAAVRHTYKVRRLLQYRTLNSLPDKIRETCEARLRYPNASMAELAAVLGISKSGLAHRFKRISDLVSRISGEAREGAR